MTIETKTTVSCMMAFRFMFSSFTMWINNLFILFNSFDRVIRQGIYIAAGKRLTKLDEYKNCNKKKNRNLPWKKIKRGGHMWWAWLSWSLDTRWIYAFWFLFFSCIKHKQYTVKYAEWSHSFPYSKHKLEFVTLSHLFYIYSNGKKRRGIDFKLFTYALEMTQKHFPNVTNFWQAQIKEKKCHKIKLTFALSVIIKHSQWNFMLCFFSIVHSRIELRSNTANVKKSVHKQCVNWPCKWMIDIYTNNKYRSNPSPLTLRCIHMVWPHDGQMVMMMHRAYFITHCPVHTVHCTPMSMLHYYLSFIFSVIKLRYLWRGNAITTTPTTITIKRKKNLFIHCQSLKWNWIRWMLNATK